METLGLKLKLKETGEEVNNCPMPINSPTLSFQLTPEPFKLNDGVIKLSTINCLVFKTYI
jgi:hypothetical protein